MLICFFSIILNATVDFETPLDKLIVMLLSHKLNRQPINKYLINQIECVLDSD